MSTGGASKPVFRGVIQRGDYFVGSNAATTRHIGYMIKMTDAKITDGTSHTILVGEKWVHVTKTLGGSGAADDRGWGDGWDFDQLRSTLIQPRSDGTDPAPAGDDMDPLNYPMGAAHSGGFNVVFADGSVSSISYDIDLETFNRLGNRSDGEIINAY